MQSIQATSPAMQYKQMLSVSNFLFQGANIRIQGTNDEPLFHCLDVVKVLGCKEANQNKFYKQFKGESTLIIAVANSHGPESINIRPINQYSDVQHYFTETGLYECLFASDSRIAKIFRREVIQLLKNIRLGVIGLQILNEEELKRQLAIKEQIIHDQARQLGDLNFQINAQQDEIQQHLKFIKNNQTKMKKIERKLYIYEARNKSTGRLYLGASFYFNQRVYQHKYRSSNRELREGFKNGDDIEFRIVKEAIVCTADDRKQVERSVIKSYPQDQLMNRQLPVPDIRRVTISQQDSPVEASPVRGRRASIPREHQVIIQSDEEEKQLPTIIETVKTCPNCRRVVTDSFATLCENCLESIKKSKVKRSQQQLNEGELFCPRCACVRSKDDFIKNREAGTSHKTCIKCRLRNTKTSQAIKQQNEANPSQKLCTLCHKPNDLDTAQCQVCLDKKKINRKRCEHGRIFDQCGEGDCIGNARNMCKIHRVRNPCGKCKSESQQQ